MVVVNEILVVITPVQLNVGTALNANFSLPCYFG